MNVLEHVELTEALERIENQFTRFQQESLQFRAEVRDDVKAIRDDVKGLQAFVNRATGALVLVRVVAGIVGFGGLIWILQLVATAKVLP